MTIIEQLRATQHQERDSGYEQYCALIVDAAKSPDGALPKTKAAKLSELVALLGFTIERVEADIAALRDHAAAALASTGREGIEVEQAKAETAFQEYVAETSRILADREAHAQQLAIEAQQHDRKLAAIDKAQQRREEIECQSWRILGLPDPAIAAKRRHVAILLKGEKLPAIQVTDLASIFASPPTGRWITGDLNFVPMSGQTQDEMDALLKIATDYCLARNSRQHVILTAPGLPELSGSPRVIRDGEEIVRLIKTSAKEFEPSFDPAQYHFARHPQMKVEAFDKLVQDILDAHKKHPWIKTEKERRDAFAEFEQAQRQSRGATVASAHPAFMGD